MRILVGLLVIGIMGIALVLPARAQEAAPPVITAVVYQGAEGLPSAIQEQLQAEAAAVTGQPYTPELANTLRENLLGLGVFQRVSTRTEAVEGGVQLIVLVEPNQVVREIVFVGNTVLSDAELREVVKTQPGEILNRNQVAEDADAIRQAYARRGYTLVRISSIDISPEGVLQFTINEPTVSEVRIEGNARTREEVIRRELLVQPGQVYNADTIRQSLANLQRLSIFQDVTVATEPGTEPGTLIVTFAVQEQRTGYVTFGGGYNNVGGLTGYINLSEANLFGTAQRVTLFAQFGATKVYQLSYFNPWIAGNRTSLAAALYDREYLHQAFFGGQEYTYLEERTGSTVTFGRPVTPVTNAFLTLRADHAESRASGDETIPEILQESVSVRSATLGAVRDTRLTPFYPVGGGYMAVDVEQAGLFGGANFTKLRGDVRRYWPVRRRRPAPAVTEEGEAPPQERSPWVLAARLLAGTSLDQPPLVDQFLVGGSTTLRGFLEDQFPGNNMVVLNTELRVPVSDAVQVVGFVDAGDAWGGRYAEVIGDESFDLHVGYGAGVRVQTPIGPLRLDYGLNGEGGHQFSFGVGQMF